jgi:predicted RNA binding protein YcfA (HicA-like mRNA interferase family)
MDANQPRKRQSLKKPALFGLVVLSDIGIGGRVRHLPRPYGDGSAATRLNDLLWDLRSKRPEPIWSKLFLYSSKLRTRPRWTAGFVARCSSRRLRFRLGRLRVLSDEEVCRILEQNGFAAIRQRGSHRIMQKRIEAATITVPVPLRDSIKRGTLASLVRQSALPRACSNMANNA